MAGANRLGDGPQALVAQAVLLEVVDDGLEEVLLRHALDCTIWYMNQVVHSERDIDAPPATVFALLADTAGWSTWGKHDEAELLEPAPGDEPEGVGAIRRFTAGRTTSVERVVAFEPGKRLAYELVSGIPIRDYHAEVTLTERAGGGTHLVWHSEFRGRFGNGPMVRRVLQRFIDETVGLLATAAEARTSTDA